MVQAAAASRSLKMFPGSKSTWFHNGKKFNYDRMIKYIYGDNSEENQLSSGHESDNEELNLNKDILIEDDGVNQYRHIYQPVYRKVKIGPSKLNKRENSLGGEESSSSQDANYQREYPPLPQPLNPPPKPSQTLGILCFCNGYCEHFHSDTNTYDEMNPSKKIKLAEDVEMKDKEEEEETEVAAETSKKRKQLDERHKWRVE